MVWDDDEHGTPNTNRRWYVHSGDRTIYDGECEADARQLADYETHRTGTPTHPHSVDQDR